MHCAGVIEGTSSFIKNITMPQEEDRAITIRWPTYPQKLSEVSTCSFRDMQAVCDVYV